MGHPHSQMEQTGMHRSFVVSSPPKGVELGCLRMTRDCGTYSPKTKRPKWLPNCLTCSGSSAARKRAANWKKAFSFCWRASIPCSISSTKTRLSLRARSFAMVSTCLAILGGRLKLRRTCFVRADFARDCFANAMVAPVYTTLVQATPTTKETLNGQGSWHPTLRKVREGWGTRRTWMKSV
jgi:hypothetical protein